MTRRIIHYNRGIIRRSVYGTFSAEVNAGGNRLRKTVKTEALARGWIDAQVTAIDTASQPLNALGLADATAARAMLPGGVSLCDAARHWLSSHGKAEPQPIDAAVAAFLAECSRSGLRPATLHQYGYQLRALVRDHPDATTMSIETASLIRWLGETKGQTRANYRTSLSAFWSWACQMGYAASNPASPIRKDRVDERPKDVFTPGQVEALLHAAPPPLARWMAIGFFGGLRTGEMARLDWRDVGPQRIFLSAAVAKARKPRYVSVCEALASWIVDKPDSGRVQPCGWTKRRKDIRMALDGAGIPHWPRNVMRHSFASYHLALHEDAPKTAFELGHESMRLLYRHYRHLVTHEAAQKYFSIRQDHVKQPIQSEGEHNTQSQ